LSALREAGNIAGGEEKEERRERSERGGERERRKRRGEREANAGKKWGARWACREQRHWQTRSDAVIQLGSGDRI